MRKLPASIPSIPSGLLTFRLLTLRPSDLQTFLVLTLPVGADLLLSPYVVTVKLHVET